MPGDISRFLKLRRAGQVSRARHNTVSGVNQLCDDQISFHRRRQTDCEVNPVCNQLQGLICKDAVQIDCWITSSELRQ